jgi:hypothetical protein
LPRPPALVHQAFDQPQPCHLVGRIDALTEGIAQRLGEAVAPLPDAQGFLADADVAFQRGNAYARKFVAWLQSAHRLS